MPTYDYECQSCGKVFEKFHSMKSRPRVKCPDCGGRAKKLLGTGANIIFKGSGFYETDYRRKRTAGSMRRIIGVREPPALNRLPKPRQAMARRRRSLKVKIQPGPGNLNSNV